MLRQSCLLTHGWGWVPPAATPTIIPVSAEPWGGDPRTHVLGMGRSQHMGCGEQASTGEMVQAASEMSLPGLRSWAISPLAPVCHS